MHIVIAGGYEQTDFLIENLKENGHKLTVINNNRDYCEKLSARHGLPVYHGDPTRYYVLEDAEIDGADVLVSLSEHDENNLTVCQFAKKCFHIAHTVCTVRNPKNVGLFQELGVDHVLSSTHMVAKFLTEAATIQDLVETLPLEDNRVNLFSVVLKGEENCIGHTLMDITLPGNTIIGCIIRQNGAMVVPSGTDTLESGDKLYILTAPGQQDAVLKALKG
ncbi:MAG: TrkA family potassium uptake protein [Clostridia bacterium]|nr:TrkA family potassium uptake protein [Clostridia bacterium]MBR1704901.1 TrkA family potassium uptake protein [Clostridia bacterium]